MAKKQKIIIIGLDGGTLNDAFVKKPKVKIIGKKEELLTKSEFDKIKKLRLSLKDKVR